MLEKAREKMKDSFQGKIVSAGQESFKKMGATAASLGSAIAKRRRIWGGGKECTGEGARQIK